MRAGRDLSWHADKVHLRSRNDKDFNTRYSAIVKALSGMPDETVIDGEIVALGFGQPSFNALQNYGSSQSYFLDADFGPVPVIRVSYEME